MRAVSMAPATPMRFEGCPTVNQRIDGEAQHEKDFFSLR
jgi:hypothetical protein